VTKTRPAHEKKNKKKREVHVTAPNSYQLNQGKKTERAIKSDAWQQKKNRVESMVAAKSKRSRPHAGGFPTRTGKRRRRVQSSA